MSETQAPVVPATETTAVAPTEGERPADYGGAGRADLIAALNEATEGGTPETSTDAPATPDTPAAAPVPEAAPSDPAAVPGEPKIAALIRAREAAQKEREAGVSEAEALRAAAREESAKILADARAAAKAEIEAERTRFRKQFADSPLKTFEEFGVDKKKLVDEVGMEGSAEWRAIQEARRDAEATRAELAELKAWRAEQGEAAKKAQEREQQASLEAVNRTFLTQHATPEKAPLLRKLPEHVLLTWAHDTAAKWRAQNIPFVDADVAEYLEHQLGGNGPSTSQQVGTASGSAPKGKANGSRTPSAAGASERRSSPKPIHEMTAAEERAALIAEYEEAARSVPR